MNPDLKDRHGACLCGGVEFTLTLKSEQAHVCHCGMCRKWGGGGPAISVDCDSAVNFTKQDTLSWYQSSEWAQRGFCKNCGTSLFYKLSLNDMDYMNVTAGALKKDADLVIKDHIYIDSKPSYYDFADNCPRYTEAETLAQFQGE